MTDDAPAEQPDDRIADIIKAVSQAGLNAQPREIAEALWLAAHAFPTSSPAVDANLVPNAAELVPQRPAGPAEEAIAVEDLPPLVLRSPTVTPVGLPPLAIERALRSLRRNVPSRYRTELDEEATAVASAETGVVLPIFRPIYERWLDVCVLVEESRSMVLWQRTIPQLRAIMERSGTFRSISFTTMRTDETGPAREGPGFDAMFDPTGRRLILIVTDCLSGWWRTRDAESLLTRLARQGPVAIAQTLPYRLWNGCRPDFTPVTFRPIGPGGATADMRVTTRDRPGPDGIAIPVIELSPRWFTAWAGMVAGRSDGAVHGVALCTRQTPPVIERPPANEPHEPDELLRRFRATASPPAGELLRRLAAVVPLTMPRMEVAANLVGAGSDHLAEVLLSGMLRRFGPAADELFEFVPGVRAALLAELAPADAALIYDRTSRADLSDMMSGTVDRAIRPARLPFANAAVQVLRRIGGRHLALARELEAAVPADRHPPKDPLPRPGLRDKIAAALRRGPVVVPPGRGARTAARDVASSHLGQVLWLDAATPTLLRSALCRHADRLGLPSSQPVDTGHRRVLDALADDRAGHWLVVLDGAGGPAEIEPLLPESPARVLIVSGHRDWPSHGVQVVVPPALTPDEASALLSARDVPSAEHPAVVGGAHGHPFVLDLIGRAWWHPIRADLLDTDIGSPPVVLDASVRGLDRHEPAAAEALRLAACFGPAPIPIPALMAAGATAAALDRLVRLGLLTVRSGEGMWLHPEVRRAVRTAGRRASEAAVADALDDDGSALADAQLALLPDLARPIRERLIRRRLAAGDGEEAGLLAEEPWQRQRNALGPRHPTTVAAAGLLAQARLAQGRPRAALDLLDDARFEPESSADAIEAWCRLDEFRTAQRLARRARHRGHPVSVRAALDLGWTSWWSGRHRWAAGVHRAAHRSVRSRFGDAEPLRLRHEFDLLTTGRPAAADGRDIEVTDERSARRVAHGSLLHRYAGEPRLALATAEAAASWYQNHATAAMLWDALTADTRLSAALRAVGAFERAVAAGKRSHDTACGLLGPRHRLSLALACDHAISIRSAGDAEQACAILEPALTGLRSLVGAAHPIVLHAMGGLASSQAGCGRPAAAAATTRRATAAARASYGLQHPLVGRLRHATRSTFDIDLPIR